MHRPTLLVYGLKDRLVDPRTSSRAARSFPDARLLVLPDSGHVSQLEHPEVVAGAIRRLVGEPGHAGDAEAGPTARPFADMVRGVRYVFLAIAAFAVGSAFVLGHPLPLIIGLIVAAVDVIETSFLLVVGGRTGTGTEG